MKVFTVILVSIAALALASDEEDDEPIINEPIIDDPGYDIDPGYYVKPIPCKEDEERCGYFQCYTPGGDDVCHNNATLCRKSEQLCGWACYNDETEQCFDGETVCGKSEVNCGPLCGDASSGQQCLKNGNGFYWCDSNEKLCGSWGCYSEEEKECYEEQDLLCSKGEVPCGKYLCKKDGEECTKEEAEREPWVLENLSLLKLPAEPAQDEPELELK